MACFKIAFLLLLISIFMCVSQSQLVQDCHDHGDKDCSPKGCLPGQEAYCAPGHYCTCRPITETKFPPCKRDSDCKDKEKGCFKLGHHPLCSNNRCICSA
ncbi:hypothetical protein ACFE04_024450 [Oxalis oulophora]